jgi:hypothetical protein
MVSPDNLPTLQVANFSRFGRPTVNGSRLLPGQIKVATFGRSEQLDPVLLNV